MTDIATENPFDVLTPIEEEEQNPVEEGSEDGEEEKVSERVQRVKLHPETLADLEREWQAVYLQYGSYFGENKEQSDYFAMLPLTAEQRRGVLQLAQKYERDRVSVLTEDK